MAVTISTHNGSTAHREHNIRNEKVVSKENHIDLNRTHEIWIDEQPRQAYERLFGNAVKEYNDKQTRSDRKIENYYNDICNDTKKHAVYEMIIGIYGKDENGVTICDEQTGKQIMKDFVEDWHKRNPNLELIGAYYHADEDGEPHCHLDYVPVAHGYSRGMETQTGLVKALGEMGFSKKGKATAQIQWEARENKALDDICRSYGLEVDHPREKDRQHMSTEVYKAQQERDKAIDDVKDLMDQKDDLTADIDDLKAKQKKLIEQNEKINEQIYKRQEQLHEAAVVKKPSMFNKSQEVTYHKNMYESVREEIDKARDDRKYADYKMREVVKREQNVISQEQHIRPLYDKATEEYNHYRDLRHNEEKHILSKAKELVQEELSKPENKKLPEIERMRNFMDRQKRSDGKSMLQVYEENARMIDRAAAERMYSDIVKKHRGYDDELEL